MSPTDLIPAELGHDIPHAIVPCAECGMKIKASDDNREPLGRGCNTRDDIVAVEVGKDPGPRRFIVLDEAGPVDWPALLQTIEPQSPRLADVVEHQVPVEHVRNPERIFGLGPGEIPSSKLVQHITRSREERRRPYPIVFAMQLVILCMLGLLVLSVAGIR